MEMAGQLTLPVEILHMISQYLTVKDILFCSQTCHYLRAAFNDDRVWRRFVPKKSLLLEEQEQVLKPAFQLEDTLTPLCNYRVHYMRFNLVQNNWNTANKAQYTSKNPNHNTNSLFEFPKSRVTGIYKSRYLFLSCVTKSEGSNVVEGVRLEVWDVSKKPVLHTYVGIRKGCNRCFYLIGSKLVIFLCSKVFVYQINLPEKHFPLLYYFVAKGVQVVRNKCAPYERCNSNCDSWPSSIVGRYMLSHNRRCANEGNVIHVWDIANGKKRVAFALPHRGRNYVTVESSEGDEWLLRQRCHSDERDFFYLFNVKLITFSKSVKVNWALGTSILYRSYFYSFTDRLITATGQVESKCAVYDFKQPRMPKQLMERSFDNNSKGEFCMQSVIIVDSYFFIIINGGVMKVCAYTLETVQFFHCDLPIDSNTFFQFIDVFSCFFLFAHNQLLQLDMCNARKKVNVKLLLDENACSSDHYYIDLKAMTKMVKVTTSDITAIHFW